MILRREFGCWLLCVTEVLKDTTQYYSKHPVIEFEFRALIIYEMDNTYSFIKRVYVWLSCNIDIIARCLFNDARSGKNHSFVVILLIRKY